jgi:hypothetical protein
VDNVNVRAHASEHHDVETETQGTVVTTDRQPIFSERLDRRRLLKVAGGLLLMSVVDIRLPGRTAAAMTRMKWVEQGVFPKQGSYQSPVFQASQAFNSVEVVWRGDLPTGAAANFAVRVSTDGSTWSDWIETHLDSHVRSLSDPRKFQMPALVASSNYVQYRLDLIADDDGNFPAIQEVELGCVDTSAPAQYMDAPPLIDGFIIPRAGWGADESLRFDANGNEIWPPEYRPIQKVIIHHTVTENFEADPAATIRAIYYYHAITQGWGDIGYNFLVDWHGNVYEGRFGGPSVVGGHALQYNWGSLGVAITGDYSSTPVKQESLNSLVKLINDRAKNVDPAGIGYFVDKANVPNICGHRDVLSTECPGDDAYGDIPYIRGWCKGTNTPIYPEPLANGTSKAALVNVTYSPNPVFAGTELQINFEVQNTGTTTISTQGPPPGYSYTEGENFNTQGYPKLEGMYRVGLDFSGNKGLPNPFRWGLPGPLKVGETVTVTGYVRFNTPGDWNLSASLVQEWIAYLQQNVVPQKITVLPIPTNPMPQSTDPSLTYESVTQHNVPTVFHDYWSKNGGLFRFGYPLTEPFLEQSVTDGHIYTTQYFERARFEHHPENAGTQFEILLGLLGRERTKDRTNEKPFKPLPNQASTADVDFYSETGHTLRDGFRDYWNNNGGLMSFGYPISEQFQEVSKTDGKTHTVQYFERVRLEWHPENKGTQYEYLLGHLGREILIDRGWLKPDS